MSTRIDDNNMQFSTMCTVFCFQFCISFSMRIKNYVGSCISFFNFNFRAIEQIFFVTTQLSNNPSSQINLAT